MRYRVPIRTASRVAIAYGLAHIKPVLLVNEWPKSGGTWISNLLSEAMDFPFYDNQVPQFTPQILKGHFLNPFGLKKCVVVWRDGRDVMVSWYHHNFFKFKDIPINHGRVEAMRDKYRFEDYEDVRANLPAFLEGEFSNSIYPSLSWPEFVERWCQLQQFTHVYYEEYREDAAAALSSTIASVYPNRDIDEARIQAAVDKFDIQKIKKQRNPNDKGKAFFVREGKVGGWQDVYSVEALQIFNHYCGPAMKALGYA